MGKEETLQASSMAEDQGHWSTLHVQTGLQHSINAQSHRSFRSSWSAQSLLASLE